MAVDAAYLLLGNNASIKNITGKTQQEILADPQLLNSYTYTRNNPLKYIDVSGNWVGLAISVIVGFFVTPDVAVAPAPGMDEYPESPTLLEKFTTIATIEIGGTLAAKAITTTVKLIRTKILYDIVARNSDKVFKNATIVTKQTLGKEATASFGTYKTIKLEKDLTVFRV